MSISSRTNNLYQVQEYRTFSLTKDPRCSITVPKKIEDPQGSARGFMVIPLLNNATLPEYGSRAREVHFSFTITASRLSSVVENLNFFYSVYESSEAGETAKITEILNKCSRNSYFPLHISAMVRKAVKYFFKDNPATEAERYVAKQYLNMCAAHYRERKSLTDLKLDDIRQVLDKLFLDVPQTSRLTDCFNDTQTWAEVTQEQRECINKEIQVAITHIKHPDHIKVMNFVIQFGLESCFKNPWEPDGSSRPVWKDLTMTYCTSLAADVSKGTYLEQLFLFRILLTPAGKTCTPEKLYLFVLGKQREYWHRQEVNVRMLNSINEKQIKLLV
jgi:hypothetical protein